LGVVETHPTGPIVEFIAVDHLARGPCVGRCARWVKAGGVDKTSWISWPPAIILNPAVGRKRIRLKPPSAKAPFGAGKKATGPCSGISGARHRKKGQGATVGIARLW